jgi:hypothetical protein
MFQDERTIIKRNIYVRIYIYARIGPFECKALHAFYLEPIR